MFCTPECPNTSTVSADSTASTVSVTSAVSLWPSQIWQAATSSSGSNALAFFGFTLTPVCPVCRKPYRKTTMHLIPASTCDNLQASSHRDVFEGRSLLRSSVALVWVRLVITWSTRSDFHSLTPGKRFVQDVSLQLLVCSESLVHVHTIWLLVKGPKGSIQSTF